MSPRRWFPHKPQRLVSRGGHARTTLGLPRSHGMRFQGATGVASQAASQSCSNARHRGLTSAA